MATQARGVKATCFWWETYQGKQYRISATCGRSNYTEDITTKGLEHTNSCGKGTRNACG